MLLDTHALLWWLGNDAQLGTQARAIITDERNEVFVSAASTWEIAIKTRLGKLNLGRPLHPHIAQLVARNEFRMLAPDWEDAQSITLLPLHHRDPFDRMLIVQALRRGLTVLTPDRHWDLYGVSRLWA